MTQPVIATATHAQVAARALWEVLDAERRDDWTDERALQGVLLFTARYLPGFAAEFFGETHSTKDFAFADQKWGDLLGYDREFKDRGVHITNVIEIKTSWKTHDRSDERVQFDAYYVRNWSPWLDLYLLLRTIRIVLFANGAY